MKNIRFLYYLTLFILTLLLYGCVSMMEGTGRFLDGSALAEKTISIYRASKKDGVSANIQVSIVENKNAQRSLVINVNDFPMMKLRGTLPDDDGIFLFTSLDYLAGSLQGWNEYSLEVFGTGRFSLPETPADSAKLEIVEEIEFVQITAARIHRYDTRITGNDALTALRNRHERILALTRWMISQDAPRGQTIKEFEKYWKPIFFPEMVTGRSRPSNWRLPGDQFQTADSIRWNTSYTERVFSEELVPVRDSATLLRDWEEALSWIYLEYEWEDIIEMFLRQNMFYKVK
ncbi:MAG: hypothetical protein LBI28_10900 [Treponema sp.]|nr:hypothetical protein [Treponema sp.]